MRVKHTVHTNHSVTGFAKICYWLVWMFGAPNDIRDMIVQFGLSLASISLISQKRQQLVICPEVLSDVVLLNFFVTEGAFSHAKLHSYQILDA
jgi:hypothetical protein